MRDINVTLLILSAYHISNVVRAITEKIYIDKFIYRNIFLMKLCKSLAEKAETQS